MLEPLGSPHQEDNSNLWPPVNRQITESLEKKYSSAHKTPLYYGDTAMLWETPRAFFVSFRMKLQLNHVCLEYAAFGINFKFWKKEGKK